MADVRTVNNVDWELLRLEADYYYQTHCEDGEPGWPNTDIDQILARPETVTLLSKYRSMCNTRVRHWPRYFDPFHVFHSEAVHEWGKALENFLSGPQSPLSTSFIRTQNRGLFFWRFRLILFPSDPRLPWQEGLGKFGFTTLRALTENEIKNLESYLSKKFIEKGIQLQDGIKLRRDVANDYYLTIPLGSCEGKPIV